MSWFVKDGEDPIVQLTKVLNDMNRRLNDLEVVCEQHQERLGEAYEDLGVERTERRAALEHLRGRIEGAEASLNAALLKELRRRARPTRK